jgi:hypothetical protein
VKEKVIYAVVAVTYGCPEPVSARHVLGVFTAPGIVNADELEFQRVAFTARRRQAVDGQPGGDVKAAMDEVLELERGWNAKTSVVVRITEQQRVKLADETAAELRVALTLAADLGVEIVEFDDDSGGFTGLYPGDLVVTS